MKSQIDVLIKQEAQAYRKRDAKFKEKCHDEILHVNKVLSDIAEEDTARKSNLQQPQPAQKAAENKAHRADEVEPAVLSRFKYYQDLGLGASEPIAYFEGSQAAVTKYAREREEAHDEAMEAAINTFKLPKFQKKKPAHGPDSDSDAE